MDLSMMLSGEKRDAPPQDSPIPKRTRSDPSPSSPNPNPNPPQQDPITCTTVPPPPSPHPARTSPSPSATNQNSNNHTPNRPEPSPYSDLQRAVHSALENRSEALSNSEKVALALEVLRARQLELDIAQARNNIRALLDKSGSAPRTLRAVIPASTVQGLPVGLPIEIRDGKFLLSPTSNDPQALFLTLELQNFGHAQHGQERTQQTGAVGGAATEGAADGAGARKVEPDGANAV